MALVVQKYGGTSVATPQRIIDVAKIIQEERNSGHDLIIVTSAMSGETDRLLNLSKKISLFHDKRELDMLAATGEQVTSALLSMALKDLGFKVKSYCGWQIPIVTSSDFTNARIKHINVQQLNTDLANGYIVIVAGFQGINETNEITTLGRGGSDTSAVALAVALNALECQIYTDVDGIYTADPRKVSNAQKIDNVDGAWMLESASLGAKVLQVRSCELGYRYKLNIRVLSTFARHNTGTLVMNKQELENYPIISLSTLDAQSLISFKIENNTQAQIIADIYAKTSIDMLNIYHNQISFVINSQNINEITLILNQYNVVELNIIDGLVKLSLVGSGFRSNHQLNMQIWQLIGEIEVLATAHNEISMSFALKSDHVLEITEKFGALLRP